MRYKFSSAEWIGALINHMQPQSVRMIEDATGKRVVATWVSVDPTTEITMEMSEAEAKDLRDSIDKVFPRLSSIKGSKS